MLDELNEKQNSKEQLRQQIKRRVKFEEKAHYTVEDLILASSISETELIESCQHISPQQYDDVVEERSISNICGYPLCHSPPIIVKKKYHISLKNACVYDISKRKNFCSNKCYEASNFLRNQISSSPVWVRESIPKVQFTLLDRSVIKGLIGEVVLEDRRKVLQRELQSQLDDNPSLFVSVDKYSNTDNVADDVTNFNDNTDEDDEEIIDNKANKEIKLPCLSNNVQNNLEIDTAFDLNKKILDILKKKSKKLALYLDDFSVESNVKNIDHQIDNNHTLIGENGNINVGKISNGIGFSINNEKGDISNIRQFNHELKKETSDSNHASLFCNYVISSNDPSNLPASSNCEKFQRIRDRINLKNINKSILISQNEILKSYMTNNMDNKQMDISQNNTKNLCLIDEALGSQHLIDILKEYIVEWLNYGDKNVVSDKLNIELQNKCAVKFYEMVGSLRNKEENCDYACKVKQFFENTQRDKVDDGTQVVMPNVDSHSQPNIQRQIVYKNLYNSMRYLSKMYGFNIDIMSNIREIVKDFNFNNKNILLNPKQWNLVTMIFVKFLIENNEVSLPSTEFEKSLTNYLGKINVLEKQFVKLYTIFIYN